ncbi:MAG: hypothetical protein EB059_02600 [Alphaproteobacteria bacterium]|nr:hypothetical protein [Alphaproteobacteria bacterium]
MKAMIMKIAKPFLTYAACFMLALSFFTVTPTSAHAQVAKTQCSLDRSLDANYPQCPLTDTNNALLNAGYTGARIDPGNKESRTPIWVDGICHYVDATDALTASLFIPFQSKEEWIAFAANAPGVKIANCCEPRPMIVNDVPKPSASCGAGWVLKGLVDSKTIDSKTEVKLIARPNLASATSGFTLISGVEDDTYPIIKLPISRDDINASLPDIANPGKSYTAQYSCAGQDDAFVAFNMQCRDTSWQSTGVDAAAQQSFGRQTTVVPEIAATTAAQTAADCKTSVIMTYTKACTDGTPGSTSYAKVYNSCTKQVSVVTTSNTCGNINGGTNGGINGGINGCVDSTNTDTSSCPSGQSGTIVTVTRRICDGSNNGDGQTITTVTSNTCTVSPPTGTCVPSTVLTTKECNNGGAGGIITLQRRRICDGSNNGFGQSIETVFRDTCVPATACRQSTILTTSNACPGGTVVTRKIYDSCTKQITTVVVSNTCQ